MLTSKTITLVKAKIQDKEWVMGEVIAGAYLQAQEVQMQMQID